MNDAYNGTVNPTSNAVRECRNQAGMLARTDVARVPPTVVPKVKPTKRVTA